MVNKPPVKKIKKTKKELVEERKYIERTEDITIIFRFDQSKIKLVVAITPDVGKYSRAYYETLISSRGLSEDITIANTEVIEFAEYIKKSQDDPEQPKWLKAVRPLRSGEQDRDKDPILQQALTYVKAKYTTWSQQATIDALMTAVLSLATLVIEDEDGNETEVRNGLFKPITTSIGNRYWTLNEIIECPAIPDDYFDDSLENEKLQKESKPILPFRNPLEEIEQKVALIQILSDAQSVFGLNYSTLLNRYFEKIVHVAFGGSEKRDKGGL